MALKISQNSNAFKLPELTFKGLAQLGKAEAKEETLAATKEILGGIVDLDEMVPAASTQGPSPLITHCVDPRTAFGKDAESLAVDPRGPAKRSVGSIGEIMLPGIYDQLRLKAISTNDPTPPSISLSKLDREAKAAANQRIGKLGVDQGIAAEADRLGNFDRRVSFEELSQLREQLTHTSPESYESAQDLLANLQSVIDLALKVQREGNEAEELAALGHKIDGGVQKQDESLIGNNDGVLTRAEVQSFIQDREARALKARSSNRMEDAANEMVLIDLGKKLLKLVPSQAKWAGKPAAPGLGVAKEMPGQARWAGKPAAQWDADRPPAPLSGKDIHSLEKQHQFNRDFAAYEKRQVAMENYWRENDPHFEPLGQEWSGTAEGRPMAPRGNDALSVDKQNEYYKAMHKYHKQQDPEAFERASGAATGARSDGPDTPPPPLSGDDAQSVEKQKKFNADMFAYQQKLASMQLYWQMMSTIQKSADDTKRALIQNLR